MKFTLAKTIVRTLSLQVGDEVDVEEGKSFEKPLFQVFEVTARYSEEDSKSFVIVFNLEINLPELGDQSLQLEFWAFFEADQDIDDEFRNSHFPKVNAPAIAYPYLRSFVTTFLVNAGYSPLYLPTVNFSAISAQSQ